MPGRAPTTSGDTSSSSGCAAARYRPSRELPTAARGPRAGLSRRRVRARHRRPARRPRRAATASAHPAGDEPVPRGGVDRPAPHGSVGPRRPPVPLHPPPPQRRRMTARPRRAILALAALTSTLAACDSGDADPVAVSSTSPTRATSAAGNSPSTPPAASIPNVQRHRGADRPRPPDLRRSAHRRADRTRPEVHDQRRAASRSHPRRPDRRRRPGAARRADPRRIRRLWPSPPVGPQQRRHGAQRHRQPARRAATAPRSTPRCSTWSPRPAASTTCS